MAEGKTKEQSAAERLRYWKLARGAHKLKNRSSKQKRFYHTRYIYRCLSGAVLEEMSKNGNFDATQELSRRDRIHEKNQVRKQRYQEKLAAKRAAK